MIFLSLQGSPYDIGFQHGKKLKYLIQAGVRKRCRFFSKDQMPKQSILRENTARLGTEFPELMEEMRGIADAGNCCLDDILTYNFSPLPVSCSNLVFVCGDESILGHINDDIDGTFDAAFHLHRKNGDELLFIGVAGSVGIGAAINSKGLAISHSAARSNGLVNYKAFLNPPLLRRALIEKAIDCSGAKSFLSKYTFISGADNIIAVDKNNTAFVAEKLPTAVKFRYLKSEAIYCTGRALSPKIRQLVKQDIFEQNDTQITTLVNRENYFDKIIEENAGNYSFDLMADILSCTTKRIEVCNKFSNWASILSPSRPEMWISDRFPCHNKFKRFNKLTNYGERKIS